MTQAQNKIEDAIGYQKTAIAFEKSGPTINASAVVKAQNNLTNLMLIKGDYASAEPVIRDSVAVCNTHKSSLSQGQRRHTMVVYSRILRKLKKNSEAEVVESEAEKLQNSNEKTMSEEEKVKGEDDKVLSGAEKLKVQDDKAVAEVEKPKVEDDKVLSGADKPKVQDDKAVAEVEKPKVEDDKVLSGAEKPKVQDDKAVVETERLKVQDNNNLSETEKGERGLSQDGMANREAPTHTNVLAPESDQR